MSGPPRLRSTNIADTESRPVLGPAGNKARPTADNCKPSSKPLKKAERPSEKKAEVVRLPKPQAMILKQQRRQQELQNQTLLNSSMSASCSSDASSTDSSHSGRAARQSVQQLRRRKHFGSKAGKVERTEDESVWVKKAIGNEVTEDSTDCVETKTRCAWITPNTGMCSVFNSFVYYK